MAASDHRHIFVDPNPDAAQSFIERKRLFDLPRSSWAEYDLALIGEGGGVWPRDQKAIPISPQMATALGIDPAVDVLSPPELMRAILLHRWICCGTAASARTSRRRPNPIPRSVTRPTTASGSTATRSAPPSSAKVETWASPNSAASSSTSPAAASTPTPWTIQPESTRSDHEVNIKVLLDTAVGSGKLPAGQRDSLLSSMTDEVAGTRAVADNIAQNAELGFSRAYALERVRYARMLASLAERGVDLRLESLPTAAALRKRVHGETGALTSPELATMMAHVSCSPSRTCWPVTSSTTTSLTTAWPGTFPNRYAAPTPTNSAHTGCGGEIVATTLVNEDGRTCRGHPPVPADRRPAVGAEDGARLRGGQQGVRDAGRFDSISAAPVDVKTVDEMLSYTRRLMFRASRWLLAGRPQPLAVASEITRYATRVAQLSPLLPGWFGASSARDVDEAHRGLSRRRGAEEIAHQAADRSASLLPARHHRRGRDL